jgi:hypothetical protein
MTITAKPPRMEHYYRTDNNGQNQRRIINAKGKIHKILADLKDFASRGI